MKVDIHSETLSEQFYTCKCCGRGCRSFLVPVRAEEREAIEGLEDWRKRLGLSDLFVESRAAGPAGYGLAKKADGGCVFLGDDNLCLIHKVYGLKAKPLACQLFPFVFTPFAGSLRVGLRFDCPGVCESSGAALNAFRGELNALASKLVPEGAAEMPLPELRSGVRVGAAELDAVNETVLGIVSSNLVSVRERLHWVRLFLEHVEKVRWGELTAGDYDEFLGMLKRGLLVEVGKLEERDGVVRGKARRMLGQFMFLVCQPPNVAMGMKKGFWSGLGDRMSHARAMRQLGAGRGVLPKLWGDWPDCDMAVLEESFGEWPDEVEAMLGRYMTCKVAGMNYFGPNFYGYSLLDGGRSLILAMVTIGWLMRLEAVKAGREHIELSDAHGAVMAVDGNMGYSSALGFGPARLRLRYLSDYLGGLIDQFCC